MQTAVEKENARARRHGHVLQIVMSIFGMPVMVTLHHALQFGIAPNCTED